MMPSSKEYPFYMVMEETTPADAKCEILSEGKIGGELQYLRFRQCLQSFGKRNRNRRLWKSIFVRTSMNHPWVQQQMKKGGLPGESGHPTTATGQISMERYVQIDPERVCLYLKDFDFDGDTLMFGTIETAADGNGPGHKFMLSILQGIEPAVSCRSLVPQKKNPDGSTDVTGPGRIICYDRVYCPSHEEAFRDVKSDVQVGDLTNESHVNIAKESVDSEILITDKALVAQIYDSSDNAKFILDNMAPAMENAFLGISKRGAMFTVDTDEGRVYIPMHDEKHVMSKIKDFMMK